MKAGKKGIIQRFQSSLSLRIFGFFVAMAVFPLVIVAVFEYSNAKNALTDTRQQQLSVTSQLLTERFENHYNRLLDGLFMKADLASSMVSLLTRENSQQNPASKEKLLLSRQNLLATHGNLFEQSLLFNDFTQILLTDTTGRVLFSVGEGDFTGKQFHLNRSGQPVLPVADAIRRALAEEEWQYSSSYDYSDTILSTLSFRTAFFVIPLLDKSGNRVGAMGVGSRTEAYIRQTLEQGHALAPWLKTYLVDESRKVRFGPETLEAEFLYPNHPLLSSWLDAKKEKINTGIISYRNAKGESVLGIARPVNIAGNSMLLITEISEKDAFATVRDFRNHILWVMLIVLSMLLPLAFFLAMRITRPVNELCRWTRQIAKGDYADSKLTLYKDEIGKLGRSFMQMVHQLRKYDHTNKAQLWIQEGMISLNAILRRTTDLKVQAEHIIGWLCGHMPITHGEIWFCEEPENGKPVLLASNGKHETGYTEKRTYRLPLISGGWQCGCVVVQPSESFSFLQTKLLELICEPVASSLRKLCLEKRVKKISQYKSDFLSIVSHELRTPLHSIQMLSQVLEENRQNNLSESQVRSVSTIHTVSGELLHTINDILDLSRVEAGRMSLSKSTFALDDLLQTLEQRFSRLASKQGIAFEVSSKVKGVSIHTDRYRLVQILQNLIGNAIKFTEKGSVKLSVYREKNNFCFAVSDTGPGITEEKQSEIFKAFSQIDAPSRHRGSGLGLAVSRKLAGLIGGKIFLESRLGKGSVFTLRLSQNNRKQEDSFFIVNKGKDQSVLSQMRKSVISDTSVTPETAREVAGMNITVIFQDLRKAFYLSSLLEPLGVHVHLTHTKESLVKSIASTLPDIILYESNRAGILQSSCQENPELKCASILLIEDGQDMPESADMIHDKVIQLPCSLQDLMNVLIPVKKRTG